MRYSKPYDVEQVTERLLRFKVNVDDHVVYAEITCEAVLREPDSAKIDTPGDLDRAKRLLARDANWTFALEVAERYRREQGGIGYDALSPIFLSYDNVYNSK